MKDCLRILFLIFSLTEGVTSQAQVYNFPTVYSPVSCTYTYIIDITVRLDSVGITNVYFDDGTTGSFAFEAFVSYENTITNSTLPAGNFYTYDITVYSDNPNLSSPSLTNNMGAVPLVTNSAGGIGSLNNPTYVGSASAMGLSQGQYYSSPGLLAQLGYDTAVIHINLPCMDTVLSSDNTIPLHILWSRLSAKNIGNQVSLSWETFMEKDNMGFNVERSLDAVKWNTIAMLPSNARDGNSNMPLSYDFKTEEMISGTYYYRISQREGNGAIFKSNIVNVTINSQPQNIIAYPNPAKDVLHLSGVYQQSEYGIYNLTGIMVQSGYYNGKIETADLAPGIYWLRCKGRNIKIMIESGK